MGVGVRRLEREGFIGLLPSQRKDGGVRKHEDESGGEHVQGVGSELDRKCAPGPRARPAPARPLVMASF